MCEQIDCDGLSPCGVQEGWQGLKAEIHEALDSQRDHIPRPANELNSSVRGHKHNAILIEALYLITISELSSVFFLKAGRSSCNQILS